MLDLGETRKLESWSRAARRRSGQDSGRIGRTSVPGLLQLQGIITFEPVNHRRAQPTRDKYADDHIAQAAEIVVEATDRLPERAGQRQLVADQAEAPRARLMAANFSASRARVSP